MWEDTEARIGNGVDQKQVVSVEGELLEAVRHSAVQG